MCSCRGCELYVTTGQNFHAVGLLWKREHRARWLLKNRVQRLPPDAQKKPKTVTLPLQ